MKRFARRFGRQRRIRIDPNKLVVTDGARLSLVRFLDRHDWGFW